MPESEKLSNGRLRAEIFRAGRADLKFRLLVYFSCLLATLGLLADSAAVVIGAMLVAPLLGPIMALGEASLGGRPRMLAVAGAALAEGALTAVFISFVVAEGLSRMSLDVLQSIPGEVSARTRPNPLDLGIALAGGTIGAYALVRMRDSTAIPGVAIATALMPPLCTIGIGLAVRDPGIWGGAALLFLTNLIAIMFSASLVFWATGLRPRGDHRHSVSGVIVGALGLAVLTASLFGLTARAIGESREASALRKASEAALAQVLPGSEIVEVRRSVGAHGGLDVRLTASTPHEATQDDATAIQQLIAQDMQKRIALVLVSVPVIVLDTQEPPARDVTVVIRQPSPSPAASATATPSPSPSPSSLATATAAPTLAPTATVVPPPVGNSP